MRGTPKLRRAETAASMARMPLWSTAARRVAVYIALFAAVTSLASLITGKGVYWIAAEFQTGIGAVIGFLALMEAALYNARLNRERDNYNAQLNRERDYRLREESRKAVARTQMAEPQTNQPQAQYGRQGIDTCAKADDPTEAFILAMFATISTPTLEANSGRIGDLGDEVARKAAKLFSTITRTNRITMKLVEMGPEDRLEAEFLKTYANEMSLLAEEASELENALRRSIE